MKKYLMLLSGISAIGIGAIAGTINTNNNNVESMKTTVANTYLTSKDEVKYDITNDSQTVTLENLLSSLKGLNKIHTEQSKEVVLSGLPPLVMLNDEGTLLGQTYMSAITWVNLNGLINSNTIDFENVSMIISNNQITVLLNYKVGDTDQMLELFTYNGNVPLTQDHMTAFLALQYETN